MDKISFEAFDAWVATQSEFIQREAFFDEAEHFLDEGVQFHDGNLVVGKLEVSPVTVIDGDLTVEELEIPFDVGLLVVRGNLNCTHLHRTKGVVVGGNLNAQSVCLNTLNDYALMVGGDVNCNFFSEFGCYVEIQGKLRCPKAISLLNEVVAHGGVDGEIVSDIQDQEMGEVLVREVLTDDGYFDEDKFKSLVRRGVSPFV